MTNEPLFSVLIVNQNQADFSEITIRSIFAQDYENIEVIVADLISIDRSIDTLMNLQDEFGGKLRWFSGFEDNKARSINKALALATGQIIGIMNPGDTYTEQTCSKVLEYFNAHPNHQAVYGNAQTMSYFGELTGKFEIKPPSTPLDALASGSFVPASSLFIQHKALEQVGNLDETYKENFSLDLIFKLFKRFPRQIGLIRSNLSLTRHMSSIDVYRLNRQFVLESVQIIYSHLSNVPEDWFWDYFAKVSERYPFDSNELNLIKQVESFLRDAKGFFKTEQLDHILSRLKTDYRLGLSSPGLFVNVHSDGWVSNRVVLKYKWEKNPAKGILMGCNALWPTEGKMKLKVISPSGNIERTNVEVPSKFMLRFEVPAVEQSGQIAWVIETAQSFVPSKHNKSSKDIRKLSFKVESLKLEIDSPT
jgi:glycosyltransferase involved in cell wall biosynthesis